MTTSSPFPGPDSAQAAGGPAAQDASQLPASVRGAMDLGGQAPASGAAAPAGGSAPSGAADGAASYRRDVDGPEAFQDAAQLSAQVPVLMVLWAGYSPSSREFVDQVEQLVDSRAGRMVLAAVDVEKVPEVAQALQAQSVPVVVGLIGGRPVPIAQQAMPAEQLAPILDELQTLAEQNGVAGTAEPTVAEQEKPLPPLHQEAVDRMAEGDLEGAQAAYQKALAENPGDHEAKLALAQVELLRRVQPMDAQAVRTAAAENPQDVQAQLQVADLDVAGGHVEDAFARLLDVVRRTAGEDRDAARGRLIELFDVVGGEDPRVVAARSQLMRALF